VSHLDTAAVATLIAEIEERVQALDAILAPAHKRAEKEDRALVREYERIAAQGRSLHCDPDHDAILSAVPASDCGNVLYGMLTLRTCMRDTLRSLRRDLKTYERAEERLGKQKVQYVKALAKWASKKVKEKGR